MGAAKDSIAAVATPPGEGGVAIVRISGPEAIEIGNRVFSGDVESYTTHTAHYGKVVDGEGRALDNALLLLLKGARSYTGEDTVEIHCHGGSLITRSVLGAVLAAGARCAEPGEFTFRAFMNGKLDLTQAEAVQELIAAKSALAMDSAKEHLAGKLSAKIASFQAELTQIAAILEAWVDFPEEGLEFASQEAILAKLTLVINEVERLRNTYHDGQIAKEGVKVCLIGSPNVGKSSLMNALLDKERSIVTPIPGTTRDLLEEEMRLGNLTLRLTDTAGIRTTSELVEQEGIKRTQGAIAKADLILCVLDLTRELLPEEKELLASLPADKTLAVWNKRDVQQKMTPVPLPHVSISAKKRIGLEELTERVEQLIWRGSMPSKDEVWITSLRHKEALDNAWTALLNTRKGLKDHLSPELLCIDLRSALRELGTIIGTDVTEDILTAIFAKFCVGK